MNKADLQATISEELDLEDFSEDEQGEIIAKLGEFIIRRAYSAILDELSDDEKEELSERMNDGDRQKVLAFIFEKVPHAQLLVKNAATQTIEEFQSLRA